MLPDIPDGPAAVDIDGLLEGLGVEVVETELADREVRGLARRFVVSATSLVDRLRNLGAIDDLFAEELRAALTEEAAED